MPQLRHLLPILLLLLATTFSLYFLVQDDLPVPTPFGPATPAAKPIPLPPGKPSPGHEITGITYSTTLDGDSMLTLQADSIELRKKRIGFLRFNLFHEALIKNGVFQIYEPPPQENIPSNNQKKDNSHDKLIYQEIRTSLLPLLPVKRIITIVSKPATLIIHHNDSTTTQISSSEATIGREKNEIIFTGNAKAVSGDKNLAARQIYVSLQYRRIKATQMLSFSPIPIPTPPHARGGPVITDLSLNPVH